MLRGPVCVRLVLVMRICSDVSVFLTCTQRSPCPCACTECAPEATSLQGVYARACAHTKGPASR